jgi:hypothetical protein
MTQINSVDYAAKRIHLHADTVTQGFDVIGAHFELKAFAFINASSEQNYSSPTSAEGNLAKGNGLFTPRFGLIASGWRFVPYDQVSHILRILVETISKDLLVDRDVFDRSTLPASITVDIDSVYDKVEIREIETGNLTAEQFQQIALTVWSYKRA